MGMDNDRFDGLELNEFALRAVNVASFATMDRADVERIEAEAAQRLKIVAPPIVGKLLIDASERGKENEDCLSVKLLRLNRWISEGQDHDGATSADVEKCRRFPQKKYVERTDEYIVAITPLNVDHLLTSWREGEYQLTAGARLMLDVYFSQVQASQQHLSVRAQFLANGVAPALEGYYHVEGLPPYPHQAVAFDSGRFAEFFAFIMDPGTGKTRVEIDIVCDRARRARLEWIQAHGGDGTEDPNLPWQDEATDEWAPQFRWLIVAPKTVCRTWTRELAKWATLDVNVERLSGTYVREDGTTVRAQSKLERAGLLATLLSDKQTPILVAVINYDGLEVLEDFLKSADDRPVWDRMTCDESIAIKNCETARAKCVYRVGGGARSRSILNGTPISKNILDLYGQYHFLKPGLLGYTSFYLFEQYYGERNYMGGHSGYKKEKLPELQERLSKNSFVIKRSQCVKLPEKIYATIEPELQGEQKAAYEQMAEKMIIDLEHVAAGKTLTTAEARDHQIKMMMGDFDKDKVSFATIVLVQWLRLAQITSGFITMEDKSVHSFEEQPKLDALEEHLDSLQPEQRIVVWSRFRPEIENVVARFQQKYGCEAIYGGVQDKVREQRLIAHEKGHVLPGHRVPCRMLVIQPQSGGFGLNELIGSSDVNHLSNEWPLMYRQQSEDRTHRIGVNASVLYNDYIIPNTIDQIMWERIQAKRELSEMLTDPANVIAALKTQLAGLRAR